MKTYVFFISLAISVNTFAQSGSSEKENHYPVLIISYNPVFFLHDYDVETSNNIPVSSANGEVINTTIDPSFKDDNYDYNDFYTGHEFRAGLRLSKWFEFGAGYHRFISFIDLDLNAQSSQSYYVQGYGSYTARENYIFKYEPAFNSVLGYIKFHIQLLESKQKGDWKSFSLNLNPEYSFSINFLSSANSSYGIASPVFPDSYTFHTDYPMDPYIMDYNFISEQSPSSEVLHSKTNLFGIGFSFDCLKYLSLYVDLSYYTSLNKDKLYIDCYYFQQGSSTGTHIMSPATLTNMFALKTGIALKIPL